MDPRAKQLLTVGAIAFGLFQLNKSVDYINSNLTRLEVAHSGSRPEPEPPTALEHLQPVFAQAQIGGQGQLAKSMNPAYSLPELKESRLGKVKKTSPKQPAEAEPVDPEDLAIPQVPPHTRSTHFLVGLLQVDPGPQFEPEPRPNFAKRLADRLQVQGLSRDPTGAFINGRWLQPGAVVATRKYEHEVKKAGEIRPVTDEVTIRVRQVRLDRGVLLSDGTKTAWVDWAWAS